MKRFQLLVLVAGITAAAIWLHFYRSRHTSSAAVTTLLPQDTLAFVHLPDFNRSREELHQTDLYQLWSEPVVQDFLQKPRAKIPANNDFGSAVQECASLQVKDAFFAVVSIEAHAWKMVGGFRFKGDPAEADKIVANWKAKLLGKASDFEQEIVEYEKHQIQAETTGVVRLFTVRAGQWYLASNDLENLKSLLNRVDGRTKDPSVTLAEDATFAAASKHMPSSFAALGFARVDRLCEKLMPPMEKGDNESADQLALRQIRSICGATSFDVGKIRDTIFVGMPKLLDAGNLTRSSLPIATADTFLYATSFLNLAKPIPIPGSQIALGWLGGLRKITGALTENGVSLESWNAAFGQELSLVGIWPSKSHWPLLFAALPVQDAAKANKILGTVTTARANSMDWTRQEKDGVQYFTTRAGGKFFSLAPTIGLSDRMLIAGADAGSVEAALKRVASGGSALADSKKLQSAERTVPTAQQAFAYVDPALIYERVDATLRPVLFMSAAFLPGIADTIDLNKLPAAETITKHLSPIVMSQRYDGDGYISESVGPVTASQTVVGGGGLAGAAAMFYYNYNKMREPAATSTGPRTAPSTSPSIAPSPTPEESPK